MGNVETRGRKMIISEKEILKSKITVLENRIKNIDTRVHNYKLNIKNLENLKAEYEKELKGIK